MVIYLLMSYLKLFHPPAHWYNKQVLLSFLGTFTATFVRESKTKMRGVVGDPAGMKFLSLYI